MSHPDLGEDHLGGVGADAGDFVEALERASGVGVGHRAASAVRGVRPADGGSMALIARRCGW